MADLLKKNRDWLIADDLHTHLYGCLTARDVWILGRDVWKARGDRLTAYASRFEKAFGRYPDFESYWQSDAGAESLALDWECRGPHLFEQFEARFGLAIALFPVSSARDDLRVLDAVLARHATEGRRYVEYRMVYPPPHAGLTLDTYLSGLCSAMVRFAAASGGSFEPRLALSLSRDPVLALEQYTNVRAWVDSVRSEIAAILTGIDFSGYEEIHEAGSLAPVARHIHADNRANPSRALALLVHAGETMEDRQLMNALARIDAAVAMGAHRIGHAIAAGVAVDPGSAESHMQQRILERLSEGDAPVIECCITSNMCLGGVGNPELHPAHIFVEKGVRVCFATDDPGIFATDASREATLAVQVVGESAFVQACALAGQSRSEILSGRSKL